MNIRNCGDIIRCKDENFRNELNTKTSYSGIVLFPTSEQSKDVWCLMVTPNGKFAKMEPEKYTKFYASRPKATYANLENIIKNPNSKNGKIANLKEKRFIDLLEKFYNFQNNMDTPKKEFLEIKDKTAVLLNLLKMNLQIGVDRNQITDETLEKLKGIKDEEKLKEIYSAELLLAGSADEEKVKYDLLSSEKERRYCEKIIEIYNNLKNMNFDKLNFNDPNNAVRNTYIDFKNKNYFINADAIFADVAVLLDEDKKVAVEKFIKLEQEREEEKLKAKELKIKEKGKAKKAKKEEARINNQNARIERNIAKYGKSEWYK